MNTPKKTKIYNLVILDKSGSITFHDDYHLLPFDGILDAEGVARRLSAIGFTSCLTFELSRRARIGDVPVYAHLSDEAYVAHAFMRATRLASLCHPPHAYRATV